MAWILWGLGLWVSWRYIDLDSTSMVASALAPLCFVACLIVVLIKVVRLMRRGGAGHDDGDGGSIWDWFDGDGWGDGGGDGGD